MQHSTEPSDSPHRLKRVSQHTSTTLFQCPTFRSASPMPIVILLYTACYKYFVQIRNASSHKKFSALLTLLLICGATAHAFAWGSPPEKPIKTPTAVRNKVNITSLPYEEGLNAPLEEAVKKIDFALLKTLAQMDVTGNAISLQNVEIRNKNGEDYHFQRMHLFLHKQKKERVLDALKTSLALWTKDATLSESATNQYSIVVHGVPTHTLTLLAPESPPAPPAVPHEEKADNLPVPSKGKIAIVIDDLGESLAAANTLAALQYHVTFAIWPRSSHATQIAHIASEAGKEIMIHQPMEPLRYPMVKPGPGCVFNEMTRDQIRTIIFENLKLVPHAIGLNNHMGSRFTQDIAGVNAVISELAEHNMFVLDSFTHPKSIFYREAMSHNLPTYKRNVFIDVNKDVDNIVYQLEKTERIALAKGQAIAIGHPMPETLEALKQWQTKRNPAIQIVPVHTLPPLQK